MSLYSVDTAKLVRTRYLFDGFGDVLEAYGKELGEKDLADAISDVSYEKILEAIDNVAKSYNDAGAKMRNVSVNIAYIGRTYATTDSKVTTRASALVAPRYASSSGGDDSDYMPGDLTKNGASIYTDLSDTTPPTDDPKQSGEKPGEKSRSTAGVVSGGIDYGQALYDFFFGDGNLSDLLKLAKEGGDFWKSMYEWLKEHAKNGDLDAFTDQNRLKIGALGVLSALFGFGGSMSEAIEKLNAGEYTDMGDFLNDWVTDLGGGGVDTFVAIFHMFDDPANPLSPKASRDFSLNADSVKTIFSMVGQTLKSLSKYKNDDGVLSWQDLGFTSIDVGTMGAWCLPGAHAVNELIHHFFPSWSAENAAEGYKILGDYLGDALYKSAEGWKYLYNGVKDSVKQHWAQLGW